MTCVAWDGKTLAADKRASDHGGIARTVVKIERYMGALLAITGKWDVAAELRQWFMAGANASDFPAEARKDEATLVVIRPGQPILTFCSGPVPMPMYADKIAFGSGRDFAEAAMFLGCDAHRAVEVACHFQIDCGNGIDTLTLG